MTRWTRNILYAVLIGLFVCWVIYLIAGGQQTPSLSDVLPIIFGSLLVGGTLTSVLWSLGLTRLSHGADRERSAIVLTYLEQAVRLNLPLPQMLRAAEASEPGWIASALARLRKELEAGRSMADSIRKAVPGTSARTVSLIRVSERVGRVGHELNRIVRQQQRDQSPTTGDRAYLRSYPVAMTIVVGVIVSMIMIFVIPKYMQIFRDFKIELPSVTLFVIQYSDSFHTLLWLAMGITAALLIAAFRISRRYFNWPGPLNPLTTSRDLADVCHMIAEGLQAGLALDAAVDGAAALSIGRPLTGKLRKWADGIAAGMSSAEAAHAAGLPNLIAGLTTTAEGFAFLSGYYASQFSRLRILLHAAAIPAVVFMFGIIVGTVALALFMPAVALINSSGPFQSVL